MPRKNIIIYRRENRLSNSVVRCWRCDANAFSSTASLYPYETSKARAAYFVLVRTAGSRSQNFRMQKRGKCHLQSYDCLCKYTPEAKRFKSVKKRDRMVKHVLNFHLDICRKAFHSFENACNSWTALPKGWVDVNNNFWEMQLQEDAERVHLHYRK